MVTGASAAQARDPRPATAGARTPARPALPSACRKPRRSRPRVSSSRVRRRAQVASVSSCSRIGSSAGLFLLALVAVLSFGLFLLLPFGAAFGRARSHRLGLERPVAHLQVSLEALALLLVEQRLAVLVVRRMRERAERAFEQQAGVDPGGLAG